MVFSFEEEEAQGLEQVSGGHLCDWDPLNWTERIHETISLDMVGICWADDQGPWNECGGWGGISSEGLQKTI